MVCKLFLRSHRHAGGWVAVCVVVRSLRGVESEHSSLAIFI